MMELLSWFEVRDVVIKGRTVCHLHKAMDATDEPSKESSCMSSDSKGENVPNWPIRMMNGVMDFGLLQPLPKISS
jgi:hypothetical protein